MWCRLWCGRGAAGERRLTRVSTFMPNRSGAWTDPAFACRPRRRQADDDARHVQPCRRCDRLAGGTEHTPTVDAVTAGSWRPLLREGGPQPAGHDSSAGDQDGEWTPLQPGESCRHRTRRAWGRAWRGRREDVEIRRRGRPESATPGAPHPTATATGAAATPLATTTRLACPAGVPAGSRHRAVERRPGVTAMEDMWNV